MSHLLCYCIISTLLITGAFPSLIQGAPESAIGRSTVWGDKTVTDNLTLENESIIIEGNLTIGYGGNVSFIDCNINMMSQYCNALLLAVDNGGALSLYNTTLRSNTSVGYTIRLYDGSSCKFRMSDISGFGCFCDTMFWDGIVTESKDFLIENCTLHIVGEGICIPTSASTTILNSTFYPDYYYAQADATICLDMIYTDSASYLRIENSTLIGEISDELACGPRFLTRGTLIMKNSTVKQCNNILGSLNYGLIQNCTFFTNCTQVYPGLMVFNMKNKLLFDHCKFENGRGVGFEAFESEIRLKDSICIGAGTDIYLNDFDNVPYDCVILELLNTTTRPPSMSNSPHEVRYLGLLDVDVVGERNGTPIGNATVKVNDVRGNKVYENQTGADGSVKDIELLWKKIDQDGTTTFTPHTIYVTKDKGSATPVDVDVPTTRNITIYYDDIPPFINITYPPDGLLTNSSDINILGTTEPDAILTVNGKTMENDYGNINCTVQLHEGFNQLTIRAADQNGNFEQASRNVTSMTRLPVIILDEPINGTITNISSIKVTGWTDGSRLEINRVPVELNPSGNFTYNYSFQGEGVTTITLRAWDIANNTNYVRVKVTYDATPPDIEITSPVDDTLTNQSATTIIGSVHGASILELDGLRVNISGDESFSCDVSLFEGQNTFTFTAWDEAGNSCLTILTIIKDSYIELHVREPVDGLLTNNPNITVSGWTEAGATVTVYGLPAENNNGNFSVVIRLTEGHRTINVSARDPAGNIALESVHIIVDLTPPEITVLSPSNLTSNISDIQLKIRSETRANLTINGTRIVSEGNGIFSYNAKLFLGPNNVTIEAIDSAGNINVTMITITYSPPINPKPSPAAPKSGFPIWILWIVALVAIISVLTAYLRHRHRAKNN